MFEMNANLMISDESARGVSASICVRLQLAWEVSRPLVTCGSCAALEAAVMPA